MTKEEWRNYREFDIISREMNGGTAVRRSNGEVITAVGIQAAFGLETGKTIVEG
jgi:hypothetical protein